MANGQPQTIGAELFAQVASLFVDSTPASAFLLARLKREAEKLQGADAVEASVVKSAIAAYEWRDDDAHYWVKNFLSLRKSAASYQNASVTMRALNDFKSAGEYSLLASEFAHGDPGLAIKSVNALLIAGSFSEAHKIALSFRESNSELATACSEIEKLQQELGAIGISEERILAEMEMAAAVATANKVRIHSVEHLVSRDPDGGSSIYIPLNFFGDISTELDLEADFSAKLASDAQWDPVKLSIEFAHS